MEVQQIFKGARSHRRGRLIFLFCLCLSVFFILSSCEEKDKKGNILSTATSGNLNLCVDENLAPVFKEELKIFSDSYPKAKVKVEYLPEAEVIRKFRSDSATLCVLGKKLTDAENSVFAKRNLKVVYTKIAYDGIAVIINKHNPVKEITYDNLGKILTGKIQNWHTLDANNKDKITVVFDNPKSGIFREVREKFSIAALPPTLFGLSSVSEVIDKVSSDKNMIGFIGVNHISNYKVKQVQEFNDKIEVAGIFHPDTSKFAGKSYKPYQAYLATKEYPLLREIYMLNSEGRNGLATGFASFVAGERGQAIIQKACLMPVNAIVRVVHLKTQKIQ